MTDATKSKLLIGAACFFLGLSGIAQFMSGVCRLIIAHDKAGDAPLERIAAALEKPKFTITGEGPTIIKLPYPWYDNGKTTCTISVKRGAEKPIVIGASFQYRIVEEPEAAVSKLAGSTKPSDGFPMAVSGGPRPGPRLDDIPLEEGHGKLRSVEVE